MTNREPKHDTDGDGTIESDIDSEIINGTVSKHATSISNSYTVSSDEGTVVAGPLTGTGSITGSGKLTVVGPEMTNVFRDNVDAKTYNLTNLGLLGTTSIDNTDYNETVNSLGTVSGSTDIDLTSGNVVEGTLGGDTTFTFSNASSSPDGNSFTLVIQQDGSGGHNITWPSSVQWDSGTSPSLTTNANDKHMLSFISVDGGTNWIGIEGPQEIA